MTVITTRSSMRVNPIADCGLWIADWTRVLRIRNPKSAIRNCSAVRDTQHLLDRRDPRLHLAPAVAPQRHHPLRLGELPQRARVRGREELALDLVRDEEQLEDPRAAAISRLATGGTAAAALELERSHRLVCEQRDGPGIGRVALAALGADLPDEPLGEHALERRGDQVRLDLQVREPGDSARRIVRVEGREYEMPGESGLDGERGGLVVPHLADHHDVRVLAQDTPERTSERHARLRVHRHLVTPSRWYSTGSSTVTIFSAV